MSSMIKMKYSDLREAADALTEFETSFGAMMLADALETMLSGKAKPLKGLSTVLQEDEKAQAVLKKSDVKFDGKIAFNWHKSRIAKDVKKNGADKVMKHLRQSGEGTGSEGGHGATMLTKAAKLIDLDATAGAFDRQPLAKLFGPLELDPKTGKKITDKDQALIRGAALSALAKLTPEMRAEIRARSAVSALPKSIRRKLVKLWGWVFASQVVSIPVAVGFPNTVAEPPEPSTPANSALKFNLLRVECLDDTDGGEMGDDEIELGGASGSGMENAPAAGTVAVFGPFDVGSYRAGDSRNYSTPYILDNWGLTNLQYPHTFIVNLVMSERDSNDKFADVLQDFANGVGPDIGALITAVSVAAGTAIGVGIGTALGTAIAPLIGSIIGAVVGALVGLLSAWISGIVDPEIFENVQVMAVLLETPDHFIDGSTSTPPETVTFLDHGGHYEVRCNFTLH